MKLPAGLKSVEGLTRIGWLALAAGIGYVLWRKFRTEPAVRTEILPPIAGVKPNDPSQPAPVTHAPPTGIQLGGLTSAVHAAIIDPPKGGRTDRRWLSSTAPIDVEIVNDSVDAQRAQIEIVADFYEFAGGERKGVRTMLAPVTIGPQRALRLSFAMDTDNVNMLAFEVASQANAVVSVYTNGKITQSTSFEVW